MEAHGDKQLNFTINKNIEELIQQIEPLIKQNQANVNISSLLDKFYKNVIQSETYLRHGIFTINFAKAATFLDHAVCIYSKQVDFLWDMSIDSQRRHLSYEEESKEKEEAQKKLDEKAQKGKRGRKKKVVEEQKKEVDWNKARLKMKKYCRRVLANITEFDFEGEADIAELDPSTLEAFRNIRPINNWDKMYPNKYLMWPYVENNYTTQIDEDCWYKSGSAATNYMDFLFPEIQRKFTCNYTNNKKSEVVGCDVSDQAFQRYIVEHGINPCDFTTETYQNFKKYLDKYLTCGPQEALLAEQRKKLCPRRPSIMVTRLPDDVVQQHLKLDEAVPGTSRQNSNSAEDIDASELPDFSEEAGILPKESSTPMLRESDRLAAANPVEKPEGNLTPEEGQQRLTDLDNTPKSNRNQEELKKIKRKQVNDENDEPVPKRKRLRKREIFKWLKTTTVALKRFEKFFYKHYLTEEGEGEIEVPDFSSDEEDNTETAQTELSQNVNLSQTLTDSGYAETSHLTQNTDVGQTSLSQTRIEDTQENNNTLENDNLQENSGTQVTVDESSSSSDDGLPWDFEITESDEMLRRFVRWTKYIRKELKKYTQKDFDIHEYGTKILEKLSEEKPARFADVLQDNSVNDVARYFAAALQLVNTENIELTNWTPGEVAADLEVTLLSRERLHEHLDSYQAPSKELVEERIKHLQNVGPTTSNIGIDCDLQTNERQVTRTTARKTYKRIKLSL